MNSPESIAAEKRRLVAAAMDLIARNRESLSKASLAADLRVPRAKIDAVFAEDADLAAAIVDAWFAPDVAIMEEVVASDLPPNRKMYEFFARRFLVEQQRYQEDPALFALYLEMGQQYFANVEGYIQLADHYLTEIIAEAQAAGYFEGLSLSRALTLINQMVICYTSPQLMLIIASRLSETKLAAIVDTLFVGLTAEDRGASGLQPMQPVSQS